MCRPNWGALILSEQLLGTETVVYTKRCEGSHREILDKVIGHTGLFSSIYLTKDNILYEAYHDYDSHKEIGMLPLNRKTIDIKENTIPMECIWSKEPAVKFQPNVNKFYSSDEIPSKKDFQKTQEVFDSEMGTTSKLLDWLRCCSEIYDSDSFWTGSFESLREFSRLEWGGNKNILSGFMLSRFGVVGEVKKMINRMSYIKFEQFFREKLFMDKTPKDFNYETNEDLMPPRELFLELASEFLMSPDCVVEAWKERVQ